MSITRQTPLPLSDEHIDLLAPPDRPAKVAQLISSVREGEQVARYETDRITTAGRRIDVAVTLSPASDNAETVPGTWTLVQEITQRKDAESNVHNGPVPAISQLRQRARRPPAVLGTSRAVALGRGRTNELHNPNLFDYGRRSAPTPVGASC